MRTSPQSLLVTVPCCPARGSRRASVKVSRHQPDHGTPHDLHNGETKQRQCLDSNLNWCSIHSSSAWVVRFQSRGPVAFPSSQDLCCWQKLWPGVHCVLLLLAPGNVGCRLRLFAIALPNEMARDAPQNQRGRWRVGWGDRQLGR